MADGRGNTAEAGQTARASGPSPAPSAGAARRRSERFWDPTDSGWRLVSRPIVVDGLRVPRVRIELTPRIVEVGGQLVDDSYNAVDRMAGQFVRVFTVEQLAMSTVALRVHMRKSREHLARKRALQERWTAVARRLMKLRVEGERVKFRDARLAEKKAEAVSLGAPRSDVLALLAIEEAELVEARLAWQGQSDEAWRAWGALEAEDAILMRSAPSYEQTKDLRHPYLLTLLASRTGNGSRPPRSVATAMHTLVEALQRPLSRTDQMLLEIAFRRCIRDAAPVSEERDVEGWERRLLEAASHDYVKDFPWALAHIGPA